MRAMTGACWVLSLVALLSLTFTHDHRGETETYYVSADHLFLLRCHLGDAHASVTWSKDGGHNLSLPSGVEVRDGLLWFLPIQTSHNGTYTCEKRDKTGISQMKFGVSVSTGNCPYSPEHVSVPQGVSRALPCKQRELFRLNNRRHIQWMKDCRPIEPVSVDENGNMRLPAASEQDAGKYTCLVNISMDGRNYIAARSIQLTVNNDTVITVPELVYPQRDVVTVKVGTRAELRCLALLGFSEDHQTQMYWTVEEDFTDEYKELKESTKFSFSRGRMYGQSTLSISKVLRLFLNVSIHCIVMNPAGQKVGLVVLQEADHSALYTGVALCLAASVVILAVVVASLIFKVDMVLAYRKLLRHFSKQAPDGKLYDGYVSFLHPDTLSSAVMASFALQILPEELEKKHGYTLYIRGRDDCPGEAVHDVIAATMRQCRRLIILLSPETKSSTNGEAEEASPFRDDKNLLCYEQKIGIYDALTQNGPQVILVEIDGPVDYSRLPESLHYIRRKQGALKWKKPPHETHKPTKVHPNRNFWKNLRYHMPSVPTGGLQTVA